MTAAAQTSEPANPPTGEVRLLAVARWLITLIYVHLLMGRARELIAAFRRGSTKLDDTILARRFGTTDRDQILTRVTEALRRATALQADLLALRPTRQGLPLETRRAIAAELAVIWRDLGIFCGKAARAVAQRVFQRVPYWTRLTELAPRFESCSPIPPPTATGPPHAGRESTDGYQNAGVPLEILQARTRVFLTLRVFVVNFLTAAVRSSQAPPACSPA